MVIRIFGGLRVSLLRFCVGVSLVRIFTRRLIFVSSRRRRLSVIFFNGICKLR